MKLSLCATYTECFFPLKVEFLLHNIVLARLGSDKLSGFKLTLRKQLRAPYGCFQM